MKNVRAISNTPSENFFLGRKKKRFHATGRSCVNQGS